MEILKNRKSIVLFVILNLFLANTNAQTNIIKAFEESYRLESLGRISQAIDKIKSVYSEDSYEINLRLGWLNYENGLFKESIANYKRALSLMPYSEEAKFGLILPTTAIGQWDNVIDIYNQILENSPNNTTANYRLGLIHYGKEDYQKAYNYFKKVVDLYPFGYDGLIIFAQTNYKLGKYREAKILFNKVLMLYPKDAKALEGLEKIK
jgi:tetratricopeptide (TPR) repeat protein